MQFSCRSLLITNFRSTFFLFFFLLSVAHFLQKHNWTVSRSKYHCAEIIVDFSFVSVQARALKKSPAYWYVHDTFLLVFVLHCFVEIALRCFLYWLYTIKFRVCELSAMCLQFSVFTFTINERREEKKLCVLRTRKSD